MPARAKASRIFPRFVPHCDGATARAGTSFKPERKSELTPFPRPNRPTQQAESVDRLAHDARNVLSGLMLYSELLAEPGVLNAPHDHYAEELDGIVRTAARILEKIVAAVEREEPATRPETLPSTSAVSLAPVPVTDAAAELRRLQPLLAAMAGPAVKLSVATMPCAGRTALAVEDLTRVLINLVRNAADAMPYGGHVRVTAQYADGLSFAAPAPSSKEISVPHGVLLTVSDDGPGVPEALREQVFDLGFSTRTEDASWPAPRRRGIGLSIVRNLVKAAGGSVRLTASHASGARFEIVLPLNDTVTSGTCAARPSRVFSADSGEEGRIECE